MMMRAVSESVVGENTSRPSEGNRVLTMYSHFSATARPLFASL